MTTKIKSDIFHRILKAFFIGDIILKCFSNLFNCHLSMSLQKLTQTCQEEQN